MFTYTEIQALIATKKHLISGKLRQGSNKMIAVLRLLTGLMILASTVSQPPPNFGPGGLYSCHCPSGAACDATTGACPGACAPGYYNPACQIKNIAFGGTPADSDYRDQRFALDGLVDTNTSAGANCTRAVEGQCSRRVFWTVNMKSVMDVSAIWLLGPVSNDANNWVNLTAQVTLGTSANWIVAPVCYKVMGPVTPGQWYRGTCAKKLSGLYSGVRKVSCLNNVPVALNLCEVVVIKDFFLGVSLTELNATHAIGELQSTQYYDSDLLYIMTVYKEPGSRCSNKTAVRVADFRLSTKNNIFAVKNLSIFYTQYTIEVSPFRNGDYLGGRNRVEFTTRAKAPQQYPSSLNFTQQTTRSVTLQWSAIACDAWNGPNGRYEWQLRSGGQLNASGETNLTQVTTALWPFHQFEARVRVRNAVGNTPYRTVVFTSAPALPNKAPTGFQASKPTASSVTLDWDSLPTQDWNGPGGYYRLQALQAGKVVEETNATATTHTFLRLTPFTNYMFKVFSGNTVGYLNQSSNVTVKTAADVPTAPSNLSVLFYNKSSILLGWQPPLHVYGDFKDYTVNCTVGGKTSSFPAIKDTEFLLTNLSAGTHVTCRVSASNTQLGYGSAAVISQHTKPPIPPQLDVPDITQVDSFKIEFLLYPLHKSPLTRYYLILVEEVPTRSLRSVSQFSCNSTNAQVALNISANRVSARGLKVAIGDQTALGFNITLRNGSSYVFHFVAANVAGTDAAFSCNSSLPFLMENLEPVRNTQLPTEESEKSIMLPVVGSVAAVLLLGTAAAVFVLIRRRKASKRNKHDEAAKSPEFASIPETETEVSRSATIKEDTPYQSLEVLTANTPKPTHETEESAAQSSGSCLQTTGIPKENFLEHVRVMKQNNCQNFLNEYMAIPENREAETLAGSAFELRKKNRYKNILAYDHNRIQLKEKESDYINASFIRGFSSNHFYVAAQAPTAASREDFVHLLWQENIEQIVMLNQVVENGKIRCSQYWPDHKSDTLDIAPYRVILVDESKEENYVIRSLKLQKDPGGPSRRVVQYHFTSWPDYGVPRLCDGMLQLRQAVHERNRDVPLLVHCGAGVGRTGTFIALDMLLDCPQRFAVQECVAHLRKQRMNMVQVEQQYVLLHEALLEAQTVGLQPLSTADFLLRVQLPDCIAQLKMQFKVLDVVAAEESPRVATEEEVYALSEEYGEYFDRSAIILNLGVPLTCTLKLVEIPSTLIQRSDAPVKSLKEFSLELINQKKPDQVVIFENSNKTVSLASKDSATGAAASEEQIYANVMPEASAESKFSVTSESCIDVTPCLRKETLIIRESSADENTYANFEQEPTSLWSGSVFCFTIPEKTTSKSKTQIHCLDSQRDTVCELLKPLLKWNSNTLIFYERDSLPLLQLLVLGCAAAERYEKRRLVDLYSAAKLLRQDMKCQNASFTITEAAYCDAHCVLKQYISANQQHENFST